MASLRDILSSGARQGLRTAVYTLLPGARFIGENIVPVRPAARATADAIIDRTIRPEIDAANERTRQVDNMVAQAAARARREGRIDEAKRLGSMLGAGSIDLENDVLGRRLTTPGEAASAYAGLASLAIPGSFAAVSRLPSAAARLGAYSGIAGTSNAVLQFPGEALDRGVGEAAKGVPRNFAAGFVANTALSPRLAYRALAGRGDEVAQTSINAIARNLPPAETSARQMISVTPAQEAFERELYGGSSMLDVVGGSKGATRLAQASRGAQESIGQVIAKGLSSEDSLARGAARTVRGFAGQAGSSREQIEALARLNGTMGQGSQMAIDAQDRVYEGIRKAGLNLEESLERIHAVLDPELAKVPLRDVDLLPAELEAANFIRQASDVINDMNYNSGLISQELWEKGRGGKYLARAYKDYELPPEVADFMSGGRNKIDQGQFKQRKDVDEWKVENAIRDPAYLMAKRLQQAYQNDAIQNYGKFILTKPGLTSDVLQKGYTQLSDSPSWGALRGKIVRQDVLEGIKGFYSDNQAMQKVFDLLNSYDRLGIRRGLKASKTVINPATRLGNQIGNRVFAVLNGVSPLRFEKNFWKARKMLNENSDVVRFARSQGLLGNDSSRELIRERMINLGVSDQNIIQKAWKWAGDTYGRSDEQAKIAALLSHIEKGTSLQEAVTRVRNGFQDYSSVGLFYDLGAKSPILGNAFIRFQGDLSRILKNAALENPLAMAGLLGTVAATGRILSDASGETPEDRETRENRTGAPKIPFTNISLEFQTPFGAINGARLFGLYANVPAGEANMNTSQLARMLPFQIPGSADELKKSLGSDVLIGPGIATAFDTDFRGKSIADPDQNRYQQSTLTPGEQNLNRGEYLLRSYTPPIFNSAKDFYDAMQGSPDFYGKERTPTQSALRFAGIKVEQYGPNEAQAQRDKESVFAQNKTNQINELIRKVEKQEAAGEISPEQADRRIESLQGKKQQPKAVTIGTQTASAGGSTANKAIRQSRSDNLFRFNKANGDQSEGYPSAKKAEEAWARDQVSSGLQDKVEVNGKRYYQDSEGNTKSLDITKYQTDIASAQYKFDADFFKDSGDLQNWTKATTAEIQRRSSYIDSLDPSTQMDDILKEELALSKLQKELEKYQSYGGFKKGSSRSARGAQGAKARSIAASASIKAPSLKNRAPKLPSARSTRAKRKVAVRQTSKLTRR